MLATLKDVRKAHAILKDMDGYGYPAASWHAGALSFVWRDDDHGRFLARGYVGLLLCAKIAATRHDHIVTLD